MGKLIVELPDEVHRELKKKSADNHKTIKDIITRLVDEYLHVAEKRDMAKKQAFVANGMMRKQQTRS